MALEIHGELIPVGGGDTIPLRKEVMTIGRREICDIKLPFPNISGKHCELSFRNGYWFLRDIGSTNGIKVNGMRVVQRPLRPGDELAIANRRYTIQYNLPATALAEIESLLAEDEDITSQSLMEKAGLVKKRPPQRDGDDDDD
jgi:pSer/pThr/pTyr-binding forkhead associated (FHA) protein